MYNNGVEPFWWRDNAQYWLRTIGNHWQLLHVFTMANVHRLPLDMAVLKAIVSSFKMREEIDMESEQRMLRVKQLSTLSGPLHHNARREDHASYKGKRTAVSDEQVPWRFGWAAYNPKEFTDNVVLTKGVNEGWADPPSPQEVPNLKQRESYEGEMADFLDAGVPRNPRGRTGMRGRGLLVDKVEKLELRSLEDRFKGEERFTKTLTKTHTMPSMRSHVSSGSARAEPSSTSTDLPPRPHRPAPGLAASAPAPLPQPAHAPAAQHAAPGASQSAGAPSTGGGQCKKVANVFSVVKPLPPVAPRPALRNPVLPP